MNRSITAPLILLASSCEAPFAPAGAYSLEPPPEYRVAWAKVEDCAGLRGSFDRVSWYAVPQTPFSCLGRLCRGLWVEPHNIYIAEGFLDEGGNDYFTVRHEILHDLVQSGGHPEVFSRCGLLRKGAPGMAIDTAGLEP